MKSTIIITLILTTCMMQVSAQKWMTRTGQVSFFSSTPIENIEAINNETAAAINTATGEVVFIVPIKSFKFDKALMRQHFNEGYMESDEYPKAVYKCKIAELNKINFNKDGNYNVM